MARIQVLDKHVAELIAGAAEAAAEAPSAPEACGGEEAGACEAAAAPFPGMAEKNLDYFLNRI